jgi:ABC-2 type transport system permease protein
MGVVYRGDAGAWGWFLAGSLASCMTLAASTVAAHTLTFLWGDASAIGNLVMEFFINFSIYPNKIQAAPVRAIMYSVIPVGLAVHTPLALLRSFSWPAAVAAFGGVALYCAAAFRFFYVGLKRYESGNMIATRL